MVGGARWRGNGNTIEGAALFGRKPDQSQRSGVDGSFACAGKPLAVQQPGEADLESPGVGGPTEISTLRKRMAWSGGRRTHHRHRRNSRAKRSGECGRDSARPSEGRIESNLRRVDTPRRS